MFKDLGITFFLSTFECPMLIKMWVALR